MLLGLEFRRPFMREYLREVIHRKLVTVPQGVQLIRNGERFLPDPCPDNATSRIVPGPGIENRASRFHLPGESAILMGEVEPSRGNVVSLFAPNSKAIFTCISTIRDGW